jgi:hypothetical protein
MVQQTVLTYDLLEHPDGMPRASFNYSYAKSPACVCQLVGFTIFSILCVIWVLKSTHIKHRGYGDIDEVEKQPAEAMIANRHIGAKDVGQPTMNRVLGGEKHRKPSERPKLTDSFLYVSPPPHSKGQGPSWRVLRECGAWPTGCGGLVPLLPLHRRMARQFSGRFGETSERCTQVLNRFPMCLLPVALELALFG